MNTVSLCLVICRHYCGLYREIIWRVRSGLDYYPYDNKEYVLYFKTLKSFKREIKACIIITLVWRGPYIIKCLYFVYITVHLYVGLLRVYKLITHRMT